MQYDVFDVDTVNLKQALNKLSKGDEVIAVNYLGTLKNQVVVRKNLVKVDELKTMGAASVKPNDQTDRKPRRGRGRK